MLLRRLGGLSAAVSTHLRRGLSTSAAAKRPPWAMVYIAAVVRSQDPRPWFQLAEPPCASHIFIPDHLVGLGPDPSCDTITMFGIKVRAVSGDGLLLIDLREGPATAPVIDFDSDHPDATRFVCNPISGQLFRLPDIDGTKKTSHCNSLGLITRSDNPDAPPDRYAVAELVEDKEEAGRGFLMRRFLSPKRQWDKLVSLPSPLPVAKRRHNDCDHEVVAFAGRLWWVDVTWGAISADPFSDRPELQFVELPRGSVMEPMEGIRKLSRYRRMGVSEGRLHHAEVTQDQEEPYLLSSFALEEDGSWTLQHRVALTRLSRDLCAGDKPRIGVVDPLHASVLHITVGNNSFSVDLIRRKVVRCCVLGEDAGGGAGVSNHWTGFLKPCVLPPWLGSSPIPSAGTLSSNRANAKSKTLSDMLVRVDRGKKN